MANQTGGLLPQPQSCPRHRPPYAPAGRATLPAAISVLSRARLAMWAESADWKRPLANRNERAAASHAGSLVSSPPTTTDSPVWSDA